MLIKLSIPIWYETQRIIKYTQNTNNVKKRYLRVRINITVETQFVGAIRSSRENDDYFAKPRAEICSAAL